MAKGKRFPVLYFVSLLTLAVMLVWISYYYYQSTTGACSNLQTDTVAREQVQALWREGRITVLMLPLQDCTSSTCRTQQQARLQKARTGIKALFSSDLQLLAGESEQQRDTASRLFEREPNMLPWTAKNCTSGLQSTLAQVHSKNQVFMVESACLNGLKAVDGDGLLPFELDDQEDAGLMVFVRNGASGGAPKLLACASMDDWK